MRYLLVTLLISFAALNAQTPEIHSYYEDDNGHQRSWNIDVSHMFLKVSFDAQKKKVFGEVTHSFTTKQDKVDTIFLDAININVEQAFLDGLPVKYRQIDGGLVFDAGLSHMNNTNHQLKIKYTAFPKKGIYFVGWDQKPSKDLANQTRRQVWTQGQGIDHRHWIPMVDNRADKFITEVDVTFDKSYRVLSNGELISQKEDAVGAHWHYRINNPHAGYLLMLAIDRYAVKKGKTKGGVETEFWYYPEHPERLEPSSRYTEEIIDFLEKETGYKYPWGKYSQVMVQDFMYGAMENTSATIFGDFFWVDERSYLDRNYVMVNCHEATHQWFGDLITARHDGGHWLQESFATYYPGLFEAEIGTEDDMIWYYRGNMSRALQAGLIDDIPVAHSKGGTARHYPKGASVLYMMQHLMGRTNFNRGINLYLNRNAFKGVETHDLQRGMMDATGLNMDWFLDQWAHRGGEPTYKVAYDETANQVRINVEQIQKMTETVGLFKMPIDMAIYFKNGNVIRKNLVIEEKSHSLVWDKEGNGAIDFVLFDEGSFVLKNVEFTKSVAQYLSQLKNAKYMLDRFDAVVGLKDESLNTKKEALAAAYKRENFDEIKAEIAKQLSEDPDWAKLLATAPEVEVRRALINKLSASEDNNPIFLSLLKDSSYGIIGTAMDKLKESGFEDKSAIMTAVKGVNGQGHGIKIKSLALNAVGSQSDNKKSRDLIASYASEKYEFKTRLNAFTAIKELKLNNEVALKSLLQALTSFNRRLAGPALETLQSLESNEAIGKALKSFSLEEQSNISKILVAAKIL